MNIKAGLQDGISWACFCFYTTIHSLAFARMPGAEARGGMARGDRGVAHREKPGVFGAVPLGFPTDAPSCGRGASLSLRMGEL